MLAQFPDQRGPNNIDRAPPDTANATLDSGSTPPGIPAGTVVILSASADDTLYNNSNGTEPSQNIAAAEYYVDVPPWITDPVPVPIAMSPSDGNFNSTVEAVEAAIDTTGWLEGQHIIFMRCQDSEGNWGAFSSVFLYIDNSGTPPAAPTNLNAKAKGKAKINLNWTDNADNEEGFHIYPGTDGVNFDLLDTVGPDITTYDDFTAQSGNTYYYEVCAYNGDGETCSNIASEYIK